MRITTTSKFAIATALSLAIGAVPGSAVAQSKYSTYTPPAVSTPSQAVVVNTLQLSLIPRAATPGIILVDLVDDEDEVAEDQPDFPIVTHVPSDTETDDADDSDQPNFPGVFVMYVPSDTETEDDSKDPVVGETWSDDGKDPEKDPVVGEAWSDDGKDPEKDPVVGEAWSDDGRDPEKDPVVGEAWSDDGKDPEKNPGKNPTDEDDVVWICFGFACVPFNVVDDDPGGAPPLGFIPVFGPGPGPGPGVGRGPNPGNQATETAELVRPCFAAGVIVSPADDQENSDEEQVTDSSEVLCSGAAASSPLTAVASAN